MKIPLTNVNIWLIKFIDELADYYRKYNSNIILKKFDKINNSNTTDYRQGFFGKTIKYLRY